MVQPTCGLIGDQVPYEEIDCEIRRLVRLMNACPGIRTTSSCAGHPEAPHLQAETIVQFVADSQEAAVALFAAMPHWGYTGGFAANQAVWRIVWADVRPLDGALSYGLHIGGSALYIQRQLLAEVEAAIAAVAE